MEYRDYYKILGVDRSASKGEIKRAYHKLARRYHPDVSKEPEAEARFKEVNEAYHVLKDPKARQAYDQLGSGWQQGEEFKPPPEWHFTSSRDSFDPEQMDFGGFSDFFGTIFGAGGPGNGFRTRRAGPRPGRDLHTRVRVTLEEAHQGAQRTLTLQNGDPGGGAKVRTLKVHIPRGVREGQQIRLAGQGGAGSQGGSRGDLFLEVEFAPHPWFKADGRTILLDLPVTPWEAALGARIRVPTLGGAVMLTVPAGVRNGHRLRLKGRGLPGNPPGDQMVRLYLETPAAKSEQARALYRRMADVMPFDPRAERGF